VEGVGHGWRRQDDVFAVFLFQALVEDVHVQEAQEPA
jgi:hypothetical protein